MQFTIMGPTSFQTMDVNWVEVHTAQGSFIMMAGHAPMIVIVAPGKDLTVELTDGAIKTMTIAGGILEVTRIWITLLLTHE
jgi:F0F1-type ATP synthase epsilon subunit